MPPPLSPDQRRERGRIATASRWRRDDPTLVEQRRDFRADRAEQYIRDLVNGHPALTAAQRERLAQLLRGEVA
jgi:hypothetical protein